VEALAGSWKLISCVMEDVETKEQKLLWGEFPNGRLVLTADGRWIAVQTAEGRKPPKTVDDRIAAFLSMLAYSGTYRVEGSAIFIHVDIAWDESWVGTEQVRFFRLEGDELHIEAPPQPMANFGGKTLRAILVWKRD
jgi:Lipocalin-like domain